MDLARLSDSMWWEKDTQEFIGGGCMDIHILRIPLNSLLESYVLCQRCIAPQ